jgi:DeoR/GlpR family transcriptional regulator of sugar metabolism
MAVNNRQYEILDILSAKGVVSVDELANHFKVSKMTIRRDLEKLHEDNLLQRTHGGALINKVIQTELNYSTKRNENLEIKKKLALEAVKHIQENSTIYIDAGTTSYEIALNLARNNLIIVTNDLRVANFLITTNNKVILLGGEINKDTGSFNSKISYETLTNMNIDLAIMATSAVDSNFNLCTPDENRKALKSLAISISNKAILVVDSSKFYKTSLYKIANINEFDIIISDFKKDLIDNQYLELSEYIEVK